MCPHACVRASDAVPGKGPLVIWKTRGILFPGSFEKPARFNLHYFCSTVALFSRRGFLMCSDTKNNSHGGSLGLNSGDRWPKLSKVRPPVALSTPDSNHN